MEIERKYLLSEKVRKLNLFGGVYIEQCYLSYEPEVRIRNTGKSKYNLTVKSDGGLAREEVEMEISKEDYYRLREMRISNIVKKIRYFIFSDDNSLVFELDVYTDLKKDGGNLRVIEVEFESLEQSEMFLGNEPNWFGEEVTYDKYYKNKNLAKINH